MNHPYAPCPLNHGPHEGQGALWGSPASTEGFTCFQATVFDSTEPVLFPRHSPSQPPLEVTSLLLCYQECIALAWQDPVLSLAVMGTEG